MRAWLQLMCCALHFASKVPLISNKGKLSNYTKTYNDDNGGPYYGQPKVGWGLQLWLAKPEIAGQTRGETRDESKSIFELKSSTVHEGYLY